MSLNYKGTATIEMLPNGRYFLRFSGEVVQLIRSIVIKRYGKSTKRITKKRIKQYMSKAVFEGSRLIVGEGKP